jgi:hypothetical protein
MRNYHEHSNHDGTEMPTCDLRWATDCDNIGVYYLIPEMACSACYSLCEGCHAREWIAQHDGQRLCDECLSAASERAYERWVESYYGSSAPQTDREREDALRLAQMVDRR